MGTEAFMKILQYNLHNLTYRLSVTIVVGGGVVVMVVHGGGVVCSFVCPSSKKRQTYLSIPYGIIQMLLLIYTCVTVVL